MAMTANLVFDELDTVPYAATREKVASCAELMEELAGNEAVSPEAGVKLTRAQMHALTSTIYTLDISFDPADGNPYDLTDDLITSYGRKLLAIQTMLSFSTGANVS